MPRFAANLSMMFTDAPFLERFGRAAGAGFKGVELLFPYDHEPAEVGRALAHHGLEQALFNLPPGDWAAGERGTASLPGREAEFQAGVHKAILYAAATGCRTLHCMAGMLPASADRAEREALYVMNLRWAAREVAKHQITLVIEPINTRDMPGYLINYQAQGRAVIERVAEPNLKLQLDLYHCQIMEGDLAKHIQTFLDITGHIQIAGVPERHEPDIGEINFPYLFELLDRKAYAGWVGCEYRPRGRTEDGLGWLAPWRGR